MRRQLMNSTYTFGSLKDDGSVFWHFPAGKEG